jgi:intermediate cleaving peptidase 55
VDAAGDLFSVDEAFDMNTLSSHLDQLLPRYNHVYVDAEKQNAPRKRSLFRLGSPEDGSNLEDALSRVTWSRVRPLAAELHQMRKIKSISEIALMRKAASLSANAHTKV